MSIRLFNLLIVCVSSLTECEGDDAVIIIVNLMSDIVFCSVSVCMAAQVYHEMEIRKSSTPAT